MIAMMGRGRDGRTREREIEKEERKRREAIHQSKNASFPLSSFQPTPEQHNLREQWAEQLTRSLKQLPDRL